MRILEALLPFEQDVSRDQVNIVEYQQPHRVAPQSGVGTHMDGTDTPVCKKTHQEAFI